MTGKKRTMTEPTKKIAVLGGGGSHGADTVGKLLALQPNYDIVIATSTGALMGGLVLLKKYKDLERAYTGVTQKDIFNVNPFNTDGSLKKVHSALRILRGKKTLGENKNLLKTIKKHFTLSDYCLIKTLGKDFVVVVQEVSSSEYGNDKKYISIYDYDYETFCKFIWASASVPLVCSIIEIQGKQYVDGGLTETVALKKALEFNPSSIDVFTHDPLPLFAKDYSSKKFNGIVDFAVKLFKIQRREIQKDDLQNGLIYNNCENIHTEIEIFYLANGIDFPRMVFQPSLMKKGVKLGYESVKQY